MDGPPLEAQPSSTTASPPQASTQAPPESTPVVSPLDMSLKEFTSCTDNLVASDCAADELTCVQNQRYCDLNCVACGLDFNTVGGT
jgi:hypothetical protein